MTRTKTALSPTTIPAIEPPDILLGGLEDISVGVDGEVEEVGTVEVELEAVAFEANALCALSSETIEVSFEFHST